MIRTEETSSSVPGRLDTNSLEIMEMLSLKYCLHDAVAVRRIAALRGGKDREGGATVLSVSCVIAFISDFQHPQPFEFYCQVLSI